jgi:6-phosphogluconolactonase
VGAGVILSVFANNEFEKEAKMRRVLRLLVLLPVASWFQGDTLSPAKTRNSSYILYVGTYTNADSKGIYGYRFNAASGQLSSLGLEAETVNPSFLTADRARTFLYAVNEVPQYMGAQGGAVTAFAIDRRSGKLSRLNDSSSRGADPCYISLDKAGHYVLVANYTGGNVAVLPILKDGRLASASVFEQDSGSGPNHERQQGPHAHWIETTADNRFALVADLGIDKILVYHFDPGSGALTPNNPPAANLEAGAGPRHLTFARNEKFAYVINELQSAITAFAYDSAQGHLQAFQTISTVPRDFHLPNTAAEIQVHPNGKFLYASNRGDDSIAAFSINQSTGHLTLIGHFKSGGKTPRHFAFDPTGTRLLVANQESSNIVVFNIDAHSGNLTETSRINNIGSPVCLLFVAAE